MLQNILSSLKCMSMCWLSMPKDVRADNEIQIFRNDVPFGMCPRSHTFLKFIRKEVTENELYSSRLSDENCWKVCYIYDKDLKHFFNSPLLVDWVWQILDSKSARKYSDLEDQLQRHEQLNTDLIKQLLSQLIPEDIEQMEKFEMHRFLTYGSAFHNDVEFYLEIFQDKDTQELSCKLEVLKWLVNQLWAILLNFERETLECLQKGYNNKLMEENWGGIVEMLHEKMRLYKNQRLYYENLKYTLAEQTRKKLDDISSKHLLNLVNISSRRNVSIMLEPEFITNLLFYISGETNPVVSCSTNEKKYDFVLFCKIAGLLPIKTADHLNLVETEKVESLLFSMLNILGFDKLVLSHKKEPQVVNLYIERMLRKGKGMYCIDFSTESRFVWIHIGSKTSKELKQYGSCFFEIFWRALGNILFRLYHLDKINITIMDEKDEEKIDLSKRSIIKFDKYATWESDFAFEIAFVKIYCKSNVYLHVDYPVPFPTFEQRCTSEMGDIITSTLGLQNSCLKEETGLNLLFPPGRYEKSYNCCCMSPDIRAQTLKELISLKSREIIIRFDILEDHFILLGMQNWKKETIQQISEIMDAIIAKIKKDENQLSIKILTRQQVKVDELIEAISKTKSCKCNIYIHCYCGDKMNCLNRIQCENNIKNKNIVFLNH